jgi:HEPN domain-containing protein
MVDRAQDWFAQAHRDLEQAEDSRRAKRHEWACFAAQQAAEKSAKALQLRFGQELREHIITQMLSTLTTQFAIPLDLFEKGRVLDQYSTPNGDPNWSIFDSEREAPGLAQSEQAVRYAGDILEFVRIQLARS